MAIEPVLHFPHQTYDPELRALAHEGAAHDGLSHRELVSGDGHDVVDMARKAPAAMIFVHCNDGISHNDIMKSRPEYLAACADVLLHAMLARAGRGP